MARQKEFRGPTSFCEWVVGTNIPSALGPGKKSRRTQSRNRDVIKVELTTDEETEEDSLKITYPRRRSRHKKAATSQDLQLKKVRFDEVPKKSALKKTKAYVVAESSDDDDKISDSADASSDSARSRIILIPEKDIKLHTVKLVDDSKNQDSSEPDSEADSDPDPTCKCIDCIRGRQKLARRKRRASLMKQILSSGDNLSDSETETENETDDSDEGGKKEDQKKVKKKNEGQKKDTGKDEGKDQAKDQKKDKKKQAPKNATVETESGSESGTATDDADHENSESDTKAKGKKQKNKKQNSEEEGQNAKDKDKKESDDKSSKKEDSESKKKNEPKKKDESKKKEKSSKSKSYPEATPGPNPRRPNLIEPIRAEVVQTERVIETQEDPPPNAYYDHENNVLRVYHGPVYGGFHNRGLYPKRDAANRSLPLGTMHPMQNPYFHGFTHAAPQPLVPGQGNISGAQWPSTAWPAMPWPPPNAQQNVAPEPAPAPAPPGGGSKGAFSDRAGRNNVGPVDNGMPNPYYSKQTSPFRSYGKGRTASPFAGMGAANKNGSPKVSASGWNNDGAGGSVGKGSQNGNGWGANVGDDAQNQGSGGWGNQEAQRQNNDWNNGQDAAQAQQAQDWGNGNVTHNGQGAWTNGHAEEHPAEQTNSWGVANDTGAGEADGQSNVMPGSWGGPLTWGDPTMAADTKGAVDQAGGEPSW